MSDDNYHQKDTATITPFVIIIGVLVLLGVLAWVWFFYSPSSTEQIVEAPIVTEVPLEEVEEAVVEAQTAEVEETETEVVVEPKKTLPLLNESDEPIKSELSEFSVGKAIVKTLVPERVILKTVRAVLALEEGNVVKDFRPIKSPTPGFNVVKLDEPIDPEIGQRYQINPKNYERYESYIDLLSKIDKKQLTTLYKDYYPLFKESYSQYGVDKGGFDKVLNRVIDRIINSNVHEKVSKADQVLIQPKVFYVFQNPEVEKLSSVDKLLLRIGEKNTLALKKQLKEFKQALEE